MASVPPEQTMVPRTVARSHIVSGNGFAVGSMLLWAAGFPAAEILLDAWHPITLMLLRLAMALAVLLPLWALVDGPMALAKANWGRALWIGAIGFGTGTNLLLFAQWYTDPITVALIATTTPIAATIVEVVGRKRLLNMRFILGLAASVAGGAVAVGGSYSVDLGLGLMMAIVSGFCFAWASNAAVRDFPDLTPIGRSAITFVGAALFTALIFGVAAITGDVALPSSIDTRQLGLLAVYSVAAMALSQILFIASVERLGVALTSFHVNIAPFYVMMMLIALGGVWDWRAASGAMIVGLGVLVAQSKRTG
ncbi:DMT family transporter [uncultured Tateyamaria sp.]|uniref:DMT family transporter n=1 Tax=uncultured Tateyamaria sp. TaxID=455651 RepID=UPI002633A764|nr:DMT family transporter [uncultured Tateyamaria sp.]